MVDSSLQWKDANPDKLMDTKLRVVFDAESTEKAAAAVSILVKYSWFKLVPRNHRLPWSSHLINTFYPVMWRQHSLSLKVHKPDCKIVRWVFGHAAILFQSRNCWRANLYLAHHVFEIYVIFFRYTVKVLTPLLRIISMRLRPQWKWLLKKPTWRLVNPTGTHVLC